ncbi:hypothetical protein CRUP_038098 [Coryphaenoides rupestris]|nr:hypothetical protein CRUP_038098 [Coryphaenoides rupestris]
MSPLLHLLMSPLLPSSSSSSSSSSCLPSSSSSSCLPSSSSSSSCLSSSSSSRLSSPLQAALLSSFPAIFEELLQVFSLQEVCEEERGLLGCMSSSLHAGPSTDAERLQSVARTVDSPLFSFPAPPPSPDYPIT